MGLVMAGSLSHSRSPDSCPLGCPARTSGMGRGTVQQGCIQYPSACPPWGDGDVLHWVSRRTCWATCTRTRVPGRSTRVRAVGARWGWESCGANRQSRVWKKRVSSRMFQPEEGQLLGFVSTCETFPP